MSVRGVLPHGDVHVSPLKYVSLFHTDKCQIDYSTLELVSCPATTHTISNMSSFSPIIDIHI